MTTKEQCVSHAYTQYLLFQRLLKGFAQVVELME